VPEKQRATIICLLLAVITLALYWPATHFDFVNYDDPDYVTNNPQVQHGIRGSSIAWAFTTDHASNWHPLTWISHMADCTIYGLNPRGHHLTNLLFHAINVVLLFLLLWQLTGSQWRSAIVAALFAWHPLHVESVVWVSERKDVFSAFFWMLTTMAYVRYARESTPGRVRLRRTPYFLALFFFTLGLLSKPMIVTLPFTLLLLDFWPLGRKGATKLVIEKIPFFVLAGLECVVTLWAQKSANSVVSLSVLPFSMRAANAAVSCVLYLWKMVWPTDLALPYSYSHLWTFWQAAGAAGLLLLISALAVLRRRTQPYLIVGWLWFLGTLTPVIGLIQAGIQPMADRYTYVPSIGIFIMAVWLIPSAWAMWPRPGLVFAAVVGGALVFLLTGAEMQLQYWRNSVALMTHTLSVTRNNILAEYNLGEALARQGDEADAIIHYRAALAMEPNRVEAAYNTQRQTHYNLGLIYWKHQQWPAAEEQFRACVKDSPDLANAHYNLGAVLAAEGKPEDALKEFREADRLEPGKASEAEYLATFENAYAQAGLFAQAIAVAQKTREAALAAGRKDLAAAAEKRMESYRIGKY
jgi:tetratricopeptide (TPR) repeat protein